MLVLSRKVGQKLVIDDKITIVVHRVSGNRVRLAIEAPDDVRVLRGELQETRNGFLSDREKHHRDEEFPVIFSERKAREAVAVAP